MFTGIIESIGRVTGIERARDGVRLTISSNKVSEDVVLGDSVCVNGVCLTATEIRPPHITFDAVYETIHKSTLGEMNTGDSVNLERALPVGGRLGGHMVQGHVDSTGRIASIRPIGNSYFVYIDTSPELMRYIVGKGSVAIDGISLTVAEAEDRTIALSIIPHTWENTTLKNLRAGDRVNIECDILGKYVEKMLAGYGVPATALSSSSQPEPMASPREAPRTTRGVTVDLLTRSGYMSSEAEVRGGW